LHSVTTKFKMAKPIKPTPTLTGKDAQAFHENMSKSKGDARERERLMSALKSISFDKPKSKD
jgi:hypothetical protein